MAFFLSTILLFAIPYLLVKALRLRSGSGNLLVRPLAVYRYLSYKGFRVRAINWNSAPIGILLLAAVGIVFFFSMTLGPKPYYWPNTKTRSFGNSPPIATRAGWMSIGCMPFVFATSPRSNFISALTGVSHEKLQIYHRWISYAFYVLALIHTFPFIVFHVWKGDMVKQWNTSVVYWTGVVALLAQTWLTFASMGPLRYDSYLQDRRDQL